MSPTPDPTPADIERMTAEIRAEWTAEEKMRRLRPDLRPSFTRCDGEQIEMSAEGYERHHSGRG